MRWRPLIWLLPSLLVLAVFWRLSFLSHARRAVAHRPSLQAGPAPKAGEHSGKVGPVTVPNPLLPHRLSNTPKTLGQLARSDKAILLENALVDTGQTRGLEVPEALRAHGDPGSYIIQSRRRPAGTFQALLQQAGAQVICYVPNNAYLVRATSGVAQVLATSSEVQAVLPYEPYYKLRPGLLAMALQASSSSSGAPAEASDLLSLRLLLFPDAGETTAQDIAALSTEVISKDRSPFGPQVTIGASTSQLVGLAGLPGVQEIELAGRRVAANDLSRVTLGIATDSTVVSNYLGLTGTNILVNVNDTGVDATYPGLANRVLSDQPVSATDTNGHGTHVAGIIAGNGSGSQTVSSAPGSLVPPVAFQFRGHAPGASIYSLTTGPNASDADLQQNAAQAGALISNNSWYYAGENDYDLAAASYDAAVRDALPAISGSQPVLFVFAAGNNGAGADDGTGGNPDTVQSPATAKNVITVGALEQLRRITNQTWTCASTCQTNTPWLGLSDSSNQVAAYSARGNVGIGVEGNFGRFKPDVVAPGTFVVSARSTQWDQSSYSSQSNNAIVPSPDANYFQVLSNLNSGLDPFYRFESGTSLAAASVSGTLALMQEFFQQRLGQTNSPALMKALLINGARSLTNLHGFSVQAATNAQGWGLVHLPSSAPAGLSNSNATRLPMLVFDQSPALALATDQSQTRFVSVSPAAMNQPLRITLVWTDPPANPVVATKLVNDLDLIVTNLDSGEVFLGNDIPPGSSFNEPSDPATFAGRDFVNNVENVYLAPGLGSNYSVTVLARRVSVNAVSEQTNDVVQDYALVIASGDGQIGDALSLTQQGPVTWATSPEVTFVTNAFAINSGDFGQMLMHQRAGANSPLPATNLVALAGAPGEFLSVGELQQWQFYVFTNTPGYTNVAFFTFLPDGIGLASPQLGAAQPDIDVYVSTNAALTNLDPTVLANADLSVTRGGEETIVYTNAAPGVFYIGVKSESQQGADYGFVAIASPMPFSQVDALGNELLQGFVVPASIPAAQGNQPGQSWVFALCPDSLPVHRVIVTNTLTCSSLADLQGSLWHNGASVVLANHSGTGMVNQATFIYDDSPQADVGAAQPSDGPGSLLEFGGSEGYGQWRLDLLSTNSPGTENSFWVFLEQQQDLSSAVSATILPGACREDFISLPEAVTNLTAIVTFASGTGPIAMQVGRCGEPLQECPQVSMSSQGTNGLVILDDTSHPPLNPGNYFVRVCNLGPDAVTANITALPTSDGGPPPLQDFTSTVPMPIPDDAISVSTIEVTNPQPILSVEVGVRIDHPRVADLALSLVSPQGTEVLLDQNRGGLSPAGLGCNAVITSTVPVSYSGGPQAVTNTIDSGQTSGIIGINYNFYDLPDDMKVYYDGNLLFDSGLVSYTGSTNIAYGPGNSTSFTIVMNQGGNTNANTSWFYSVTSTRLIPVYLTFTEDTVVAPGPIKFAAPPLTNINYFGLGNRLGNGIFYLPEQSLVQLTGEPAAGSWRLKIVDTRTGPGGPQPMLWTWQLAFRFQDTVPVPISLVDSQPSTNTLPMGQIQWFSVDAPSWVSFATNSLIQSSAPVNLLFNPSMPPTGTNSGDVTLLAGLTAGTVVLSTNSLPPLNPGTRFYLGVQNTNATAVTFMLGLDFDIDNVITLQSGVPYANTNPGLPDDDDYYRYVVTTNAVRVQFEINGPSSPVTLVARKGAPPPGPSSYDYVSANSYTNDQLIVVYTYSSPVALAPGEWFLTVINPSSFPAAYTILATEFTDYGTNIAITSSTAASNLLCLSWNSLPGIHYFVQGKESLEDTNWVTLSPTLTATDVATEFCVPLPTPFEFFRVDEGLVITPPPLLIGSITYGTKSVTLQWQAATNHEFQVEWTAALGSGQWVSFTNVLTSTTGTFSFVDDGSQSGGLGQTRFYRLRQLPD